MMDKAKWKVVANLGYSIGAVVLFNVVLQFVVYPFLSAQVGEEEFGIIIYLLSIITILSNSAGIALNYTRVVIHRQLETKNGDYNTFLLGFGGVAVIVCCIILYFSGRLTVLDALLFSMLTILTAVRWYADVEFKMSLRYSLYFLFYVILSAGNVLGLLVFKGTGNWYLAIMLGEILALLFSVFRKKLFCRPVFSLSQNHRVVWRKASALTVSYAISNVIMNIDRLLLMNLISGTAVSIFYKASLFGKTLAMVIGPLNGVIIAYLAQYDGHLSKKNYLKIVFGVIAISTVAFFGCILVAPYVLQFLYPEVFDEVNRILSLATVGQIAFFASNLLLVIVLRFCHEKYQLYIEVFCGILYVALAVPATLWYGIDGFAVATLIANVIKFIVVCVVGVTHMGGPTLIKSSDVEEGAQ